MYATNYHRQVMKNLPDNPKPTRRAFVKKAAASTVASGALLSGCGPQSDEPSKPKLNSLYDDPHSPVNLPGRDDYRRPPNWGPSVRANWDAKNVIVIMLDSFRADHLGALGGSKGLTPNLDQFASESTLFTRCDPEGLPTIPVRTSLFTGKFTYPFRTWQALHP